MTENRTKHLLGIALITLHLIVFIAIFLSYTAGGLNFNEFTTTTAIIVPMFAGFTTSIVVYFRQKRYAEEDESKKVTKTFVFLTFLYPIIFFAIIMYCIYAQSYGKLFANFEQFKTTVTLTEAVFASYIGAFVYSLFEQRDKSNP